MHALKFTWPYENHPTFRKNFEEAMGAFITRAAQVGTFCHEGRVEVDIALTMPLNGRHNAVLVCSCGKPRATLESTAEDLSWKFHPIARH